MKGTQDEFVKNVCSICKNTNAEDCSIVRKDDGEYDCVNKKIEQKNGRCEMADNPFDEMLEENKKIGQEVIKNMTIERAIEIINRIANASMRRYVPNAKNTKFVPSKEKPIYFVGDVGRLAIKTVLEALEKSIPKKKVEDKIKELEQLKVQLPIEHLKQAQIKVLKELLEDK